MNPKFQAAVIDVEKGMVSFMPHGDYKQADIDRCVSILKDFDRHMESVTDTELALNEVRDTILKLNALNESCDDSLIETDQREGICIAIIELTQELGFNEGGEDITEEWREW